MKLLKIKLLNTPFRSLQEGFEITFNPHTDEKSLNPLCFAGLNGSGKSNLLELLSEIFFYLDLIHLKYENAQKRAPDYDFEIEYLMPIRYDNPYMDLINPLKHQDYPYYTVKITKHKKQKPKFSYWFSEGNIYPADKETHHFLPSKIIAYTSGMNELISNAYYKMKYHYFHEFELMQKRSQEYSIDSSRMFIIDNKENAAIFIANYILNDKKKLDEVSKTIEIDDIHSFRITIQTSNSNRNPVRISNQHLKNIDRLKKCATLYHEKKTKNTNIITLDFYINDESKKAFRHQFFSSPFELYKTFYELEMLNIFLIPKKIRDLIRKPPKWLNISDEIPETDPSKLVFRIEKIQIRKKGVPNPIYYKSLSDGEHQFMQVIGSLMMMEEDGCLFLYDEPETHFNPVWRSRLISKLSKVSKKMENTDSDMNRFQEVIITTHSPFVLSDIKKENVYIFDRKHGNVKYEQPESETYGSSISFIMRGIFDKDDTISDMAKKELERLKKKVKTLENVNQVKKELLKYGDSIEKFDLYSYINQKEKELKKA